MNPQSMIDSFIRSGGAPLVSQAGLVFPGMVNSEGTEIKFQSTIYPVSGDVVTLFGSEHYLILDVFPKLNAETVATVCRLRFTAHFSRYPETSKDSFGREPAGYLPYLVDQLLYIRHAGEDQVDAIVPTRYSVQLLDVVTIEEKNYSVRQVSKDGGVCQLLLLESRSRP